MRLLRRGLFMPDMWGGRRPVYCPCPFSKPGGGRATGLQPEGKPEGEETREDQDAEDPPSSHGDQGPSLCDVPRDRTWGNDRSMRRSEERRVGKECRTREEAEE